MARSGSVGLCALRCEHGLVLGLLRHECNEMKWRTRCVGVNRVFSTEKRLNQQSVSSPCLHSLSSYCTLRWQEQLCIQDELLQLDAERPIVTAIQSTVVYPPWWLFFQYPIVPLALVPLVPLDDGSPTCSIIQPSAPAALDSRA